MKSNQPSEIEEKIPSKEKDAITEKLQEIKSSKPIEEGSEPTEYPSEAKSIEHQKEEIAITLEKTQSLEKDIEKLMLSSKTASSDEKIENLKRELQQIIDSVNIKQLSTIQSFHIFVNLIILRAKLPDFPSHYLEIYKLATSEIEKHNDAGLLEKIAENNLNYVIDNDLKTIEARVLLELALEASNKELSIYFNQRSLSPNESIFQRMFIAEILLRLPEDILKEKREEYLLAFQELFTAAAQPNLKGNKKAKMEYLTYEFTLYEFEKNQDKLIRTSNEIIKLYKKLIDNNEDVEEFKVNERKAQEVVYKQFNNIEYTENKRNNKRTAEEKNIELEDSKEKNKKAKNISKKQSSNNKIKKHKRDKEIEPEDKDREQPDKKEKKRKIQEKSDKQYDENIEINDNIEITEKFRKFKKNCYKKFIKHFEDEDEFNTLIEKHLTNYIKENFFSNIRQAPTYIEKLIEIAPHIINFKKLLTASDVFDPKNFNEKEKKALNSFFKNDYKKPSIKKQKSNSFFFKICHYFISAHKPGSLLYLVMQNHGCRRTLKLKFDQEQKANRSDRIRENIYTHFSLNEEFKSEDEFKEIFSDANRYIMLSNNNLIEMWENHLINDINILKTLLGDKFNFILLLTSADFLTKKTLTQEEIVKISSIFPAEYGSDQLSIDEEKNSNGIEKISYSFLLFAICLPCSNNEDNIFFPLAKTAFEKSYITFKKIETYKTTIKYNDVLEIFSKVLVEYKKYPTLGTTQFTPVIDGAILKIIGEGLNDQIQLKKTTSLLIGLALQARLDNAKTVENQIAIQNSDAKLNISNPEEYIPDSDSQIEAIIPDSNLLVEDMISDDEQNYSNNNEIKRHISSDQAIPKDDVISVLDNKSDNNDIKPISRNGASFFHSKNYQIQSNYLVPNSNYYNSDAKILKMEIEEFINNFSQLTDLPSVHFDGQQPDIQDPLKKIISDINNQKTIKELHNCLEKIIFNSDSSFLNISFDIMDKYSPLKNYLYEKFFSINMDMLSINSSSENNKGIPTP